MNNASDTTMANRAMILPSDDLVFELDDGDSS